MSNKFKLLFGGVLFVFSHFFRFSHFILFYFISSNELLSLFTSHNYQLWFIYVYTISKLLLSNCNFKKHYFGIIFQYFFSNFSTIFQQLMFLFPLSFLLFPLCSCAKECILYVTYYFMSQCDSTFLFIANSIASINHTVTFILIIFSNSFKPIPLAKQTQTDYSSFD
jgi:hypothetical protein